MAKADEYHAYARECRQWASSAKSEDQREQFLSLGRTWTHAALRIEGVMVPINPDTLPRKTPPARPLARGSP
jgi:hypothetical protein